MRLRVNILNINAHEVLCSIHTCITVIKELKMNQTYENLYDDMTDEYGRAYCRPTCELLLACQNHRKPEVINIDLR